MTAPAPFLTVETRRAIWAHLWREVLLRPRDDTPRESADQAPADNQDESDAA